MRGLIACHNDITHTPALHIVGKSHSATVANVICHNQALKPHKRRVYRSLSARRSTHIKHALTLHIVVSEQMCYELRRCLLHIVCATMQQWVERKLRALSEIFTPLAPTHSLAIEALGGLGGI